MRLSPLFSYQTGAPFDITSGTDPYGTTLYFARPGLGGSFQRRLMGPLDPNPAPGEPTIGRNAGRGPVADHGEYADQQDLADLREGGANCQGRAFGSATC